MEETPKIPLFKASLIYGAIVGLANIVIGLILYFIGQSLETWAMIFGTLVGVGLLVGALIFLKKEYGKGFISFGQVVWGAVLISLVTSILTAAYTFALFEADKSYLQDIKYFTIERIDKQMDKMDTRYQERLSDEQYEAVEKQMKIQRKKQIDKIKDRSSGSFALGNIFNQVFLGLIIGLITGGFIKKKPAPIQQ